MPQRTEEDKEQVWLHVGEVTWDWKTKKATVKDDYKTHHLKGIKGFYMESGVARFISSIKTYSKTKIIAHLTGRMKAYVENEDTLMVRPMWG